MVSCRLVFHGSASVFFASLPYFPKPSVVSCRLVLSWECFWFLCFHLMFFQASRGHLQTGSFMGVLLLSLLISFVFLSLSWSVADWLFHGSASVFFASLLCFPKPSVASCRLAPSWSCFYFLCFKLSTVGCRAALLWECFCFLCFSSLFS